MHSALKGFLGIWGGITVVVAGLLAFDDGTERSPEANASGLRLSPVSAEVVPDPVEQSQPFAYPVEACKAAIALMNDRDPSSMQGSTMPDGLAHVTWRSPDDGKRWQARCEMIGNDKLRWAAFDAFGDGQQGRWRSEDSVKVSVSEGRLHVNLDQSGVVKKQESYQLSTLM